MSLRRPATRTYIGVDYHERQEGGRCALHACNNVVGSESFRYEQFVAAATELGHSNVDDWWNGEVIRAVFARSDIWSALRCNASGFFFNMFMFFTKLRGFVGFVVARPGHWVALRRKTPHSDDLTYELSDSQKEHPETKALTSAYNWLVNDESKHVFAVWRTDETPVAAVQVGLREATRTDAPSKAEGESEDGASRGSARLRRAVSLD